MEKCIELYSNYEPYLKYNEKKWKEYLKSFDVPPNSHCSYNRYVIDMLERDWEKFIRTIKYVLFPRPIIIFAKMESDSGVSYGYKVINNGSLKTACEFELFEEHKFELNQTDLVCQTSGGKDINYCTYRVLKEGRNLNNLIKRLNEGENIHKLMRSYTNSVKKDVLRELNW